MPRAVADSARVVRLDDPELAYAMGAPYDPPNAMYSAIERLLAGLDLDRARAGTPEWNPIGDLVSPGGRVVIKPNFVSSKNLHEHITGAALEASSTHGSLLRPLIDLALRAVGPRGSVRVIDAPVEGCEIRKVIGPLGVAIVIDELRRRGHDVDFVDLRQFWVRPRFPVDDVRALGRSFNAGLLERSRLAGDPLGYAVVDLGERSWFAREGAPPGERLRFHRSHYETPVPHHTGGRHEYGVPRTLLESDLLINVSKLKTHKKTGVTLSMKGAIGLSSEKYWLPHFTEGSPEVGGDEFAVTPSPGERARDKLSRLPLPLGHSLVLRAPKLGGAPLIIDGSWEGNRTLHRTILDLVRVALYADRAGVLQDTPARRYLTVVDGVIGGEGEGPLGAKPVHAGTLVAGFDPARVDAVATSAMGFDGARIVQIVEGLAAGFVAPPWLEHPRDVPHRRLGRGSPADAGRRFLPPRAWPSLL